jgi:hypothetical protein
MPDADSLSIWLKNKTFYSVKKLKNDTIKLSFILLYMSIFRHFQETEPGFKDILKCLFIAITALQNTGALPSGTPSREAQRAALQIKNNHDCRTAKKLYRDNALKFHPDKNKNSDQSQIDMALINIANENSTCESSKKSQGSKSSKKSQGSKSSKKSQDSKPSKKSQGSKSSRKSQGSKSSRKSQGSKSSRKSQGSKSSRKSQDSDPNIDSVGVLTGGLILAGTGIYYNSEEKDKKSKPPKLRRQRTEEDAKLRNNKQKSKILPPPKIVKPPRRRSTTPPRKSKRIHF